MKISKNTLLILKNYSTINQSIVVHAGSRLSTISAVKNIFSSITVEEKFSEFAIYDLNEFLGVLSLFEDPNLEFGKSYVVISEGTAKQKYYYADPSLIQSPPDKDIELPSIELETFVSRDDLTRVLKAASINNVGDISFMGNGKTVSIAAHDKNNPSSNTFKIDLGEDEATFSFNFASENFKMIPGDYNISICAAGFAKFSHKDSDLTYFITLETDSSYAK